MRKLAPALALLLAACGAASTPTEPTVSDDPESRWRAWRDERHDEMAGPEGWLTLVGLFWLEPGESSVGSDPASTIVLPGEHAPARVGRLVREGGAVRFVAEPGVAITSDGAAIRDVVLTARSPALEVGSLRMFLIERADRVALRVRDVESPARVGFGELPVYPYDPRLRVRARVTRPDPPRMLSIVNVLGMQVDEPCAAILHVPIDGHEIELAATSSGEGGSFFLMLRDATAGEGGTYGAGRYLDVEAPDASGQTWVDFNFLESPPCAYTEFATCPLPPEENVLALPLRAGERYVAAAR